MMKWWRSLLLFCVCAVLMVACRQSLPMGNAADRIVLGTTAEISTIDPADAASSFVSSLLYNLSDRLYTYKPGTKELQPQLATALPKISEDGLIYKIPLRQGVFFHDGTAFNAEAMAFSLKRYQTNKGSATVSLSEVKKIEATGEYELTIELEKPFVAFTHLLTFTGLCAVSPKAYEIKEGSFQPKTFVGTGPYQLTKFGVDLIRLEAFDQYWGGRPVNPGVDIQRFSTESNVYNAFRTGTIDLAMQGLAVEHIRDLREAIPTRGWQMIEQPGSSITFLVPNIKSPPLNQPEVRQALALMIDRPVLQSLVFAGQVNPLYTLLPNHMEGQTPVFQSAYGDAQFEQAKTALKKAGFSAQNPAIVNLWYRSNVPNDKLAAITLKGLVNRHLDRLLKIELDSVDSTTAYSRLDKSIYPAFILDWSGDYFDPDTYLYPFLECSKGTPEDSCKSGQSASWGSFYFSDRANQLIAESRKERDLAKRQTILTQLQQIVATDVSYIPLWQGKDYLFSQKGITGASIEVTQKVPFWKLQKAS
jgi:peptide/nickel transport system substrate-binding protein